MKVTGLRQIKRQLRKKDERYRQATAAAIYAEALDVDAKAVLKVPVDTGRLRSTHYVAPPERLYNPIAEVGFGTKYGLPVHERTELNHTTGEAKFLENAMNENRPGYKNRLKLRIAQYEAANVAVGGLRGNTPEKPRVGAGGKVRRKKKKKGK